MSGRLMNCSVSASRRDPDGNCLENATCWLQGHYHFFEGIRELSAVCHQFEWLFQIFAGALGNLLPLWGSHPKTSRFLGLKWGE
jgi:hypothetical protein